MIFLDFSCIQYSPIITEDASVEDIHSTIEQVTNLNRSFYYLLHEGLPVYNDSDRVLGKLSGEICVVPRLLGGKGGFGSMLRAIGAQIEKTTNREACRDLSGRRLRDINEEQRLKTWISQHGEREREAEERKRKKLEKLSAEPRHEFKDELYDQARSELTEKLFESVQQGLEASTSSKRPVDEDIRPKKKVRKFLKCEEEDLLSSSDESAEEYQDGSPTSASESLKIVSNEDSMNELPKSDALIMTGV